MIELGLFLAGFVVGGVACYRWGKADGYAEGHADGEFGIAPVGPAISGGPREPA